MKPTHRKWISGLSVLAFLAIWEILVVTGGVKVGDVSRPTLVVKSFFELTASGEIFQNLIISLRSFFMGFAGALVVGIPLGVVVGHYRRPALVLDPMVMAIYTVPRMAMLPLLVVWFGVGLGANAALVFFSGLFPIIINTSVGIREVDQTYVGVVRSFGGSEWDVWTKVLLPGSLRQIISGIRLGVGRGILGMVVGEMYTGTEGIGGRIRVYGNSFRTSELIALITIVSILSFLMMELFQWLERRVKGHQAEKV